MKTKNIFLALLMVMLMSAVGMAQTGVRGTASTVTWTSATAVGTVSSYDLTNTQYEGVYVYISGGASLTAGAVTFEAGPSSSALTTTQMTRTDSSTNDGAYTLVSSTKQGWTGSIGPPYFQVRLSTAITTSSGNGSTTVTIVPYSFPNQKDVVASVSSSGNATSSNQTSAAQKTQVCQSDGTCAPVDATNGLKVQATISTTGLATSANQVATPDSNTGNAGASTPRVVLATNQPAVAVTLASAPTTTVVQPTGTNLHAVLDTTSTTAVTQATGTNLHAVLDTTSTTAVTQATATNLKAQVVGAGTAGSADANPVTVQGIASGTAVSVSCLTGNCITKMAYGDGTLVQSTDIVPVTSSSATVPVVTMNSASANSGVNSAIAGVFDDTSPTSITENSFGFARISANRNLYNTIRDAAGNERGANVDANNNLGVVLPAETTKVIGTVRQLGNGGATLDSVVGAGTAPTNQQVVGCLYNSTELSPTTGQAMAVQCDSKGRARDVLMDAAGNTRGLNIDASNHAGVVNYNSAGTEVGTSGAPFRTDPVGTTTQPVQGVVGGTGLPVIVSCGTATEIQGNAVVTGVTSSNLTFTMADATTFTAKASNRIEIHSYQTVNIGATNALITFTMDNPAPTTLAYGVAPTSTTPFGGSNVTLPTPMFTTVQNKAMSIQANGSSTSIYVTVQGCVVP